ncbi:uncharacterized protein KIAA1671 homolog [Eudromia elegans]
MATKVEISSALAPLAAVPDLKEIAGEEKPQRVYVSVLPGASSKASEPAAARPLQEKHQVTSTLRCATMPTLGSRPRLFPKPFSKEKSSDTFANVKPPVTAFKPSNLIRKATEEASPVKVLSGNVPPLVEHKVIESENKASSDVVTNMTFYTGPSANTVILFETAATEQSKVSLAQGKRAADDHRVFGPVQTKELPFNAKLEKPSQPPETPGKAEGSVPRQISLSSNPRPVSWNSLRTRDKEDACDDLTGEKSNADAHGVNSRAGFSDVQQRLKPRPVSAAFLESLRDQKHQPVEPVEEKSPTEKSWARKPRPLSMDLTAKFEHKDLSPCKKTCSSHESKENVSLPCVADVSCREQSEMGPKKEDKEFIKDSSYKANLKRSSHDFGVLNDGKYPWETQHKCKSEQSETKPEAVAALRGSERCSDTSSDSKTNKEAKRSDLKEACVLLAREGPAASSEKENSIKRGSVKKHISLFASEQPAAPMDTEPLPAPAERENGHVNIQQRIKELTTESADAKAGSVRRSPQSRPLSADLTKMFSSPTSSSEVKPEKPAEIRNDSAVEIQEKSKEPRPAQGTEFPEAHAAGNAWKARQVLKLSNKADGAEAKGSSLGGGQRSALQSEHSVSFTSSFEKRLKPAPVVEKTCVKTVRATMFDHNVERHSVAAGQAGADSAPKMSHGLERRPGVVALGHSRGPQVGEAVGETASIRQYHKQSHSSQHIAGAEKSGHPAPSSEGKKVTQTILLEKPAVEKSEKHTPKNVEDSVTRQRIEPRYEIFQTFGERVLSEAITMAPENKAVTLRARKSSVKERKNDGDVLHTEQPGRLNNKTDYLKEASVPSDTKDTRVSPSRFTFKEPNDFSLSGGTLTEQKKDPGKPGAAPMLIAEKIPYSTDKSKSLGINEQANQLHPDVKVEESEVPSTERPHVVKSSAETRSVRSGRADGHEFRTNFGHEAILTSVNKHGAQSSSGLSSGQVCKSSSSHHPDMEVLSTSKEKPRAFGLAKCLERNSTGQSFSLDRTAHESREKFRVTEPEEKLRRTKSSIADLKISERWRRKTLPQDSIRGEEVGLLTPESIKRLNRTESLQLEDGSVKKRTRKSKEGLEGDEPNQTANDYLKNQSSAFEPKVTYFAVTCQVPGDKKEKSFGTSSVRETCKMSPSSEMVTTDLDPVFPRRSKPALQQPSENITPASRREDSQGVHMSRDWVNAEEKSEAHSSKRIAVTNLQVSGKDNQKYHERNLDCSKDKTVDVDAFLLNQGLENTPQTDFGSSGQKVSSYYEPRSPQHFTQHHKPRELLSPKVSESNFDMAGGRAEHGYRSRILDIDALMAEYKEESVIQDKLSEDHSLFNRELQKNKRNVSDWTSSSYSWKERKGSEHSAAKNKRGDLAEDYSRPEKLILNEKSSEKQESLASEFDKQKPRDRKFSPPYWGSPSSLFSDKLANSPGDFTRKKTFIIDEDQEVNLISRQQSSTFASDKVQPASVVGTDQKLEISLASKWSVNADVGQKKSLTTEQFLEVASESDWSKEVTRSYTSKSREDAGKTSREQDSSEAKSRADWKSCPSTLGSAAPDLRRSYSEKSRQGKDNVPLTKEARARKDPYRFRQSFPPESVENGWKKKTSSLSESFFHEDKKASAKLWTKQTSGKADGADCALVSVQRRSQSFYKDRRVESWTDQLKQCFSRAPPDAKDTDTLVREPDSRYGTWGEQRHSGDSFAAESPSSENNVVPSRKQPPSSQPSSLSSQTEPASLADHHDSPKDQRSTSLDRSSTDMDSMDGTDLPPPGDAYPEEKGTDFSFIDQTTVLDSSALKTRAQLSKKRRHRAPLSHSLRRSRGSEFENRFSLEDPDSSWMFKDSTEEKKTMQQEDSDEEEKIHRLGKSSSVQAQRLPVFPGMDHAVLKAQLRKRQESEVSGETSSAQPFKSPKAPSQPGGPGSRVLPSSVEKEDRPEEKSPQWLKELKSKKRQSHYENQV